MARSKKEKKQVYHSMLEFEQKVFPKAHAEKVKGEHIRELGAEGTGLAEDAIDRIRNRLATH